MSSLRSFFLIFVANLTLLIIGIFALEMIFGNWLSVNNLNQLNIIRSSVIKYDASALYKNAEEFILYKRDQYGLRGSFSDPLEIKILTIGGSTTDQRYISEGNTWQDVLQQSFKAEGKNVPVANAGVDGQSTFGHIKNFQLWFPKIPGLNPKITLFYIGINDFFRPDAGMFDELATDNSTFSLRRIVSENSAIYHLLRTVYGVYLAEIKTGIGHRKVDFTQLVWETKPRQDSYDAMMGSHLKSYEQRINVLLTASKERGWTPVLVSQPFRTYKILRGELVGVPDLNPYNGYPINGVDMYHMMQRLNLTASQAAKNQNVLYIDLTNENLWEDDDFYDYFHMTPLGTRKVGKYLFDKLNAQF